MPLAPVQLVCTMSNGSTSVTTPKFNVAQTVTLAQDFELIEHRGLEFSLTFETTMDNEAIRPGTPTSQPGTPTRSSPAGIKRFFANSSPKKVKSGAILDPFMLYLSPSGTLAGTKVIYDEIADRCFGTKCTFQYPLVSPNPERREVLGYIQIEIFFLPAMPKHVKLPQTVDQCYKGLRAALAYHQTQYKGHLSQMGGDCHVWRRRQFHLQGSRLVAFNDVTKQAHAIVDLSMMISLEDTDDEQVARKIERTNDDDERAYVANSFRCLFRDGSEISFYADTADEKRDWMEVLAKIEKDTFTFGPWAECLVFDLRLEDARRAVHVAQLEAAKDSVDGDSLYS
ncbi:uncharacterized protein L969DRAFT_54063 [Mixia osmundae IAM 14324]|uniref:uncharacterized protein n=1 Tax=Mixia osmundae (strain CBS 9802 / IAM 14324 / JCM 22182 / KY 12970) TaxID=764103 RepID=UPI0004A54C4D|nr:uncharacterized protein L969DRAFT_54063 [Mixia osmundae IAM 14324]KEI36774.1 hypothetical protein L969DRAFT_54063 [Mixia osmundae IAM 14324]